MFGKVLIANRGEIAVRIIRTLRDLGIRSVAVYSEADRNALHVRMADEAFEVGPAPSRESYLRTDRILEVARKTGAEAIHPGYGFLSERAEFADEVRAAGLTFIGPSAASIRAMGDKVAARQAMIAAGVPVVPGTEEPVSDIEEAKAHAARVGFPIMLKAAAGGGGKGMRRVDDPAHFERDFNAARREAESAFGDGRVYMERYVTKPRHVEIQVFGDQHGNVVHLFERECSIQRRHQKVIEESPSPFISEVTRQAMGAAAVQAAKAVQYEGAGTVEFLVDDEQNFFFLEMNTRLQVEHPVTELVTGLDLVRLQLMVAAGQPLPFAQADLTQVGHAIEARVYAEDPEQNYMPSPGKIHLLMTPSGPGVRDDSGVYSGAVIPLEYDPMISKLVVWGRDRQQAIQRLRRALREYVVLGPKQNISFHLALIEHPDFVAGDFDTGFLDRVDIPAAAGPSDEDRVWAEAAAVIAAARAVHAAPSGDAGVATASIWKWSTRRGGLRGGSR